MRTSAAKGTDVNTPSRSSIDGSRVVPVLAVVAEALEEYVAACPYEHDPLFLGSRGGPYHRRLSCSACV